MATELPATLSIPFPNNIIYSPTATQKLGEDYNRHPVGTGPFILKSWAAGDRMVLERNPNYWNKGHPHLDRVELRPLPDAHSRFASLLSGAADVIWDDA
jgi:peptide/nickel transport system substrate-binding protein